MSYVHHVPGRLRVKNRAFGSDEPTRRLCRSLAACPGVNEVTLNPRSHSLIVLFDPQRVSGDDILAQVDALQETQESPAPFLSSLPLAVLPSASGLALAPLAGSLATTVGSALGKALFGALLRTSVERGVASLVAAAIR
ncbi:hypothetical protein [Pararhodospirillum oryzae]|uniref:HMA domain-containing protein n=1 Tax=Pararhodospirillum oryzae TaxID=478448 RepID=A0A512H3M3_9PROT|nr:hypothetical protein [Pararhodospirillum oryzae]GEO80000.1 hypothetical protein ROR02_01310 [Pararhodospirillum oryzae]